MKSYLLEILLGISLPLAIFHTQVSKIFTAEKPVSKQISLSIAREASYTSKVYDNSRASVRVVIFKVKNKKQVILWDKTYDTLQLRDYPTLGNALHNSVTVSNIVDSKEKLYVTYMITYNTNGSLVTVEDGTSLLKGEAQGDVQIKI
ncbi:MAG TPA: hypothetical protein VHB48_18090 [Chitinophagaceae bacterium]|jgi:hypothetical protein|nr:hypothetical protein [Chitinophagaceae bacterium]